ncbi:hypothetical protein Msi02_83710 [Microbispora siamensis]|uniref:Uncharacterized protein n=1 Tax=Microbispora siamensis TaxID=564413 RepID=A0ABQ4H1H8_9ACTN|nr:hypothetical protein Msi02_83710 [Microbispora siamensis]
MWAAIGNTVSSLFVWLIIPVAVLAVAFLGVRGLMASGHANRVESLKWKSKYLGELELTYRDSDSSSKEDSGEVAVSSDGPAKKRWWHLIRRREVTSSSRD